MIIFVFFIRDITCLRALRCQVNADPSLLAPWEIRGEHQVLSKPLPSTPASLKFNLAQPVIQSMHSLPVVKQVIAHMVLQIHVNEGFSGRMADLDSR